MAGSRAGAELGRWPLFGLNLLAAGPEIPVCRFARMSQLVFVGGFCPKGQGMADQQEHMFHTVQFKILRGGRDVNGRASLWAMRWSMTGGEEVTLDNGRIHSRPKGMVSCADGWRKINAT